ncbi:hypothetical protein BpHYR1_040170, partial [Brachionus plicatilis]
TLACAESNKRNSFKNEGDIGPKLVTIENFYCIALEVVCMPHESEAKWIKDSDVPKKIYHIIYSNYQNLQQYFLIRREDQKNLEKNY